jgi:hypothetical protein
MDSGRKHFRIGFGKGVEGSLGRYFSNLLLTAIIPRLSYDCILSCHIRKDGKLGVFTIVMWVFSLGNSLISARYSDDSCVFFFLSTKILLCLKLL